MHPGWLRSQQASGPDVRVGHKGSRDQGDRRQGDKWPVEKPKEDGGWAVAVGATTKN